VIALTFDDGPNDPYTSQVLDTLESEGVKATFFLIGENVKLYPGTVRRMVVDGDVIGNHTNTHDANHALEFNAYKDIQQAQQTIFQTAGVKPHLYRPPHGKKSPWELQAIKGEGYLEVLWSISTPELKGTSPQLMANDIVRQAKPGGIILLHDGYGTLHGAGRAVKEATVQMLPLIIGQLKAKGYSFVTVPELLNVPAYNQVAP
jgi:peptidoglycan/xylan/chitin deacetylase (PgdA/CDA1 family)